MTVVFWLLVAVVVGAFAGFPILVVLLGALLRRNHVRGAVEPRVSVLIAAYNEAAIIRRKLANTLEQRYPPERIQVIVVDDGSTDGTAAEVRALGDPRVVLVESSERGGKVTALNAGVGWATGEILVFTDANAEFEPEALARLVQAFADPTVGGVCGNQLNVRGRSALATGERLYWEYDKFLKRMESLSGSIVAADGSIYAIRREHMERIPLGVTDDFFVSTGVIEHGGRLVFDASARAVEAPLERHDDHYRRRMRITEQALLSLWARRGLMNPLRTGPYAFVLIGHKLLRRLASPAILLLLPASAWLAREGGVYRLVFGLELTLYLAALFGLLTRGRGLGKVTAAPYYFVLGVIATTAGLCRFAVGRRSLMWEPVRR